MKSINDQPINDENLLMIYYQEAKQQEIDDCLKSPQACQQLNQLEADMKSIEKAQQLQAAGHQLPDDYGQQLWNQIANQLVAEESKQPKKRAAWLQHIKNSLWVPRYSVASFAMFMGLVLVAFYAGRQQNEITTGIDIQQQLLAQNIQLHLTQSEIFLTQVSNGNGSYNSQATAQRLLSSNRIFKQALAHYDGQYTEQILQDLESIFLEYSNGASTGAENQTHGQQPQANWISDTKSSDLPNKLMFQIKAVKQQLAQKNDII